MRGRVGWGDMPPNAQQAFQTWLLKMEIIGGSACLFILVLILAVTAVLVVNFRKTI
jgi:hypothetical protein